MAQKFSEVMLSAQIQKSKDRQGYHRSDVISCPMKCYNRMIGMEAIYELQHIGMFILGELAHIALHKFFTAQEFEIMVAGIVGIHIDALANIAEWSDQKRPVETKTTRMKIYSKEQIPLEWLEQLGFGMAYLNSDIGYIMVVNVISYAVMVWKVTMSREDRELYKQAFEWKITLLMNCIAKRDPSRLEIKIKDCKYCEYKPCRKRTDGGCPFYKKEAEEKT